MDKQEWPSRCYILLWLSLQCLQAIVAQTSAHTIWTELHRVFGVQGPLQIFADFQKAISYHVWANNLAPNMLEIARAFGHCNMASIIIPTIIQAMILLNAMPKEFDSVGIKFPSPCPWSCDL